MSLSALVILLGGVVSPHGEAPPQRYAEPPTAAATFDAFLAAPPSAAPPAAVLPAAAPVTPAADWNAQSAAANPLRADAVAPTGGQQNGPTYVADAATAAASGPIQRLGTELQNAAAPLQEGFDRLGNRVGAAADKLGARTDQLLDELGGQTRSLLGGGNALATGLPQQYGTPAPSPNGEWNGGAASAVGASTAPPSTGVGGSNWNPGDAVPVAGPADAGSDWNSGATEAPPMGVAPGQFPPANQGGPTPPPLVSGNPPPAGFPQSSAPAGGSAGPVTAVNNDRWSNSPDPRFRTAAAPTAGHAAGDSGAPPTGVGPILPPPPYNPHAGAGDASPAASDSATAQPGNAGAGSEREIRGGMLNLPANRQLDDVGATASGLGDPFSGTSPTSSSPSMTTPATPPWPESRPTTAGGGLVSSYPNWNSTTSSPATPPTPAATAEAAASSARDKAAVILAWVLLFSSIAGNVYLFWSYLDVRTKYRSLVRKTARAVGSRFSAA